MYTHFLGTWDQTETSQSVPFVVTCTSRWIGSVAVVEWNMHLVLPLLFSHRGRRRISVLFFPTISIFSLPPTNTHPQHPLSSSSPSSIPRWANKERLMGERRKPERLERPHAREWPRSYSNFKKKPFLILVWKIEQDCGGVSQRLSGHFGAPQLRSHPHKWIQKKEKENPERPIDWNEKLRIFLLTPFWNLTK